MKVFAISICFLCLSVAILGCKDKSQKPAIAHTMPEAAIQIDGITINEPKTAGNLQLFMLTGREKVSGKSYTTLSDAMEAKQVTVKETGSVNELSIDNSSTDYIFIHSGDIVKGGKQDRTISYDVIIPPKTKNMPLASFCVEQGRWEQRADEVVVAFSSNTKMLSSKDLKLAAKHDRNQGKVWNKVSEQKMYLNDKLSARNGYNIDVSDSVSNSSLQLALENEDLKKSKDSIFDNLKNLITTPDAIGYAYTINGEIHGVEVYNNQQLFADLWDKLLESIIVEAISKEGEEVTVGKTEKEIRTYMEAVKATDKKTAKKINTATRFKTIQNEKGNLVFSTEDLEKQQWIHKSYMKMDTTDTAPHENLFLNSRLNGEN